MTGESHCCQFDVYGYVIVNAHTHTHTYWCIFVFVKQCVKQYRMYYGSNVIWLCVFYLITLLP